MATRAELRTMIRNIVGDESPGVRWSDTIIHLYMDEAVKRLGRIRRSYEQTGVINTVIGGVTALPAGFISMSRVVLTSTGVPLWEIQQRDINAFKGPTTSSNPSYYYITGQSIAFYPAPSAVFSLTITYFSTPPLMTADGNTPDPSLGTEADQYIRSFVVGQLALADQDMDLYTNMNQLCTQLEIDMASQAGQTDSFNYAMVSDTEGIGWQV